MNPRRRRIKERVARKKRWDANKQAFDKSLNQITEAINKHRARECMGLPFNREAFLKDAFGRD